MTSLCLHGMILFATIQATFTVHNLTPVCERIAIPMCRGLPYNETKMPNLLNHQRQDDAGLEIHQFFPLVKVQCNRQLKAFLCSVYVPECRAGIADTIPPCRAFCNQARMGCEHRMFIWPEAFECDRFPESGMCVGEHGSGANESTAISIGEDPDGGNNNHSNNNNKNNGGGDHTGGSDTGNDTRINVVDLIDLRCDEAGWNISLDMTTLQQHCPNVRAADIYLGEKSCGGVQQGRWLVFKHGLRGCVTSEKISGRILIYNNDLAHDVNDSSRQNDAGCNNWRVGVECDVRRHVSTSTRFIHIDRHDADNPVTTSGQYDVDLTFYRDPNYRHSLPGNPLKVTMATNVYVMVSTQAEDWSMKMRVHACYMSNVTPQSHARKSYLIKNGCEVNGNTHIISQSSHETRFVFQYFNYDLSHAFFVKCGVTFCDNRDYSRQCSQTCRKSGKGKKPLFSKLIGHG